MIFDISLYRFDPRRIVESQIPARRGIHLQQMSRTRASRWVDSFSLGECGQACQESRLVAFWHDMFKENSTRSCELWVQADLHGCMNAATPMSPADSGRFDDSTSLTERESLRSDSSIVISSSSDASDCPFEPKSLPD